MNIDIHMGVIGGISTKVMAFLASLVAASLPVFISGGARKEEKNKSSLN